MDCPQCNVEMVELSGDQLTLQRCTSCEGLWTDAGELNRILLHNNLPGLETMGGRPNLDEPSRPCPACEVDMIVVEGGPKLALMFETCEVCSGIWIDPDGDVATVDDAINELVGFFKRFRTHAA